MTLTGRSFFDLGRRSLQYAGLLGSILTVAVSLFSDRYGVVFAVAGALAIGLDIVAIRTRWDSIAILIALAKGIVVLLSTMVLFMGGPTAVEPTVPSGVPFTVLFYSSIASFLGALARRLTR